MGSSRPFILVDIIARICHIPEHVQCLRWRYRRSCVVVGWDDSLEQDQERVLLFNSTCPSVSTGQATELAPYYSKICGATHGHIVRFWLAWGAVIVGGFGMFVCLMRWKRNYIWGIREVISWVIFSSVPRPKRYLKVIESLDQEYMQRRQVWYPQSSMSGEFRKGI